MIKNGLKNTLQILIILIFNNFLAQQAPEKLTKTTVNDTIPKQDTIVFKKEPLESVLQTKADYNRRDFQKKMIYLNKHAQVKYQDVQIDADYISIDEEKSLMYARGKQDSLGRYIEPAVITQAGKKYETDEFQYNTKTKKQPNTK